MDLYERQVYLDVANHGRLVLGFFPKAAPKTVEYMLNLFKLHCFDTNSIFRVDKHSIQIHGISHRSVAHELSPECATFAANKSLQLEASKIAHVRGILTMEREVYFDQHSMGSSFSMMLRTDPSRDGEYTV